METYINGYLVFLEADGKSKCTIVNTKCDLKQIARYFNGIDIKDIDYAMMIDWITDMAKEGLSTKSRARKIASIRGFFKYLLRIEAIDKNPADFLKTPKLEKKEPVVISTKEASALIDTAKADAGNTIFWYRNYAILCIFLYTGIRREELVNIKFSDVNMDDSVILIHGKGNKQRSVYMNEELKSILGEYINRYRNNLLRNKETEYLFFSKNVKKLNVKNVNDIVNKIMEESGIKQYGLSSHVLRKRFATTVFENTGNIGITSKALGHSSPTVTMRYVSIDAESLRAVSECVKF